MTAIVLHAVSLVTDDRNRVRAECRSAWRTSWTIQDRESRPRQEIAERVATRHMQSAK